MNTKTSKTIQKPNIISSAKNEIMVCVPREQYRIRNYCWFSLFIVGDIFKAIKCVFHINLTCNKQVPNYYQTYIKHLDIKIELHFQHSSYITVTTKKITGHTCKQQACGRVIRPFKAL